MTRRILAIVLASMLVSPGILAAQGTTSSGSTPASKSGSISTSNAPRAAAQSQTPSSVRPQSSAQRRSYERETRHHRRRGISKGEVAFMAAIAGTSMGIGAIAAGGEGLAIGAIVGGWGAYLGHRIWNYVR